MQSALYVGSVAHRRLRPTGHRLRYRVFSVLIDLDELALLAARLRFFSVDRFNLFTFRARDHLSGDGSDLRTQVESILRAAGMEPDGGAVRLLTMPRVLGFGFNPLSIFFCYRADGALRAILYEVNNTFKQRHCYLFPVDRAHGLLTHGCDKEFYVSPFMEMDLTYGFRIRPPDETYSISICVADADGAMLNAAQSMRRRPLCDRELMRVFVTHPLLTVKVIAGIHLEALRLWMKGVGLHIRPPPPDRAVTIVAGQQSEKKGAACHV